MPSRYIRTGIKIACLLIVGRVLWIAPMISAPFVSDDDAPRRVCGSQGIAFELNRESSAVRLESDSKVIRSLSPFAFAPEAVTPNLFLREMELSGCRWLWGYLPADATKAEVRRLGVALRTQKLPVLLISDLASPFRSFSNGIVARAGFLRFGSWQELLFNRRVLVNYEAGVEALKDGKLQLVFPGSSN